MQPFFQICSDIQNAIPLWTASAPFIGGFFPAKSFLFMISRTRVHDPFLLLSILDVAVSSWRLVWQMIASAIADTTNVTTANE